MSSKFTEEVIAIAVSKNKPKLVLKINKAMEELKQSGEFYELLKDLK
jgi:ABC-type amino acid transport substrate-binding protein